MDQFSHIYYGVMKSFSVKNKKLRCPKEEGREVAETLARGAKKNSQLLCSLNSSNPHVSVFSQRGKKGINQDCTVVWEEFGCQKDMVFCGVFDGHGPWGHYISRKVRDWMPPTLLCQWQEILALNHLTSNVKKPCKTVGNDVKFGGMDCIEAFDIWKQSFLRTSALIDEELHRHRGIDSYYSGTTAVTIVKQGDLIVVANVGDSRAVLGTTSDDGNLAAVQLTVDLKPNLPQEAARIRHCNGRVYCLPDEPGVNRVWLPNEESPGLAMSRAFGDYCLKDFGLISVPEVTYRHLTNNDRFLLLASDGVWDVLSNQEAVEIIASSPQRETAAKRLVECAVKAWRWKKPGLAVDDCAAVCFYLDNFLSPNKQINSFKPASSSRVERYRNEKAYNIGKGLLCK
ncbi:hypothetical protein AMTRI_Chr02g264220 [Amborella trichopoda]|uniref:PPM-type phosphatase domain-containing protein n=1 Tax=Amborella trichopoda TaxID=13333 RepID=U5CU56_AMBTC|nr:probable protein phosphatase 2C 34 [Amborella trichopoda]ERN16831.1 hypothetical protein AMTR_s00057p00118530 [Amborella trichopoda]|eukprot:XP_006855364.1 probable protein phosphatase 2C 34 [Amborella trichopoda]